ncbi:hypothetical protein BsWGS_17819 [Bradybaena similaris]
MQELLGDASVTQFLTIALILLAVVYYVYATRHHGVWEKLGVPGPKPWPIIDHMLEQKNGEKAAIQKWFQQYGNTFGAYGIYPHCAVLVTKDLTLMKQILVKDFDNFIDRSRPRKSHSSLKYGLTTAAGDRWRRHRHVTSPMFTGARMKMIMRHVCDSAETLALLTKQKADSGQLIPLKLFASKFSTEVIARVAFGVETHAVSEQETEFAYNARKMLNVDTKLQTVVNYIYQYFPQIDQVLRFFKVNVDFVDRDADKYFVNILNSTIQDRKQRNQSGEKVRDLLDMLIKAGVEDNDPRLKDLDSRTLSHDEIVGNSTILILAGVETVAIAFQAIFYCLALHEDIQEKVVAEIDRIFPKGTRVEYEQLKELNYTEQVINECLRLFPLLSTIHRIAEKTIKYGNITIPKGTYVLMSLGEVMKDPAHWSNPEKFDPDRFSPDNKAGRDPLAFVPFGYGPRICLGMRLAMMELKTILVYLLRDFKFTLSDRTVPKKGETLLLKRFGNITERPKNPIELEVVSRE